MSNIIPFVKPERTLAGEAKCVGCNHRWAAVAPVGTTNLECPNCQRMTGQFVWPVTAGYGDVEYCCGTCGSAALTAFMREGNFYLLCMGCGVDHTEAVFG